MQEQAGRQGALSFLEEQLGLVGAHIREMQEYEAALKKSVEVLSQPRQAMLYEDAPPARHDPRWRGMHAQAACLAFLREHAGEEFRASVLANGLRERGVKGSDKRSFGSVVAGAVRRLVSKGLAEQGANQDGVAVFCIKEEAGPDDS